MKSTLIPKSGNETLLRVARGRLVALAVAKHGILFPLVFTPPLIWAIAEKAWLFAGAVALPAVFGLILWGIVYRAPLPKDLRQVEAVTVLALLFLITPILSIPAFAVLGMPMVDALFEGMSAITTTGLSLATNAADWPFAAHFLRSWMQWCGGLAMATAVLAMLIGPGSTARTLGKVSLDDGDRIASTRSRARQLLGAYAGLTLVFGIAISVSAQSAPEGLLLTLSAVSTGGFAYFSTSVASYSAVTQTLVILASIFGAVSLLAISLVSQRDWKGAWKLGSLQRVILWSIGCTAVLSLAIWMTGGQDYYVHIWNLLSAISTAGYSVGDMPTHPLLLLIFVVVMIIGGDVGSTAGGLKLGRMATLWRAGRHATRVPRFPDHAVAPLRENGDLVRDHRLIALLAVILFYTTSTILLWSAFLAYGYAPLPALFDTVSAFSTVGLSTGIVSPDNPTFLKIATTLAMLLGRLEFVAVILLVLPRTWYIPSQRS